MNKTARMSFLMALCYLVCMFDNPAGITFPILVLSIWVAAIYFMKENKYPLKKSTVFYGGSCFLISISIVLTDQAFLHICGKIGIALLVIVYFIKSCYDVENMGLIRGMLGILEFILVAIFHLTSPFWDYSSERKKRKKARAYRDGESEEDTDEVSVRAQVVKGLLISVPLLLLVGLLLTSADVVFRNVVVMLFDSSTDLDVILNMFFTFLVGFFVAYSFIRTVTEKQLQLVEGEIRQESPVVAITFTAVLSVIYVFFCALQITMMLRPSDRFLPEDYTYARYAREGFFQLLFVALINLLIVFICKIKFQRHKILQAILTIITVCTFVMLGSSAWRMLHYIREYHLTFLRVFVLWFLLLLALLMGGLIISVFREKFKLFEYCVVVVTVCYLALAFVRPDALVAKYNVRHLEDAEAVSYMIRALSEDAAEYLKEAEYDKDVEIDSEQLRRYYERIYNKYSEKDIRKWNYSKWRAYQAAKEYLGK